MLEIGKENRREDSNKKPQWECSLEGEETGKMSLERNRGEDALSCYIENLWFNSKNREKEENQNLHSYI